MKNFQEMYKEKLRTAEEAVRIVKSGDWIDFAMFNGKPVVCDRALAARKEELKDINIMAAVTIPPVPEVVLKDPQGEVFTYNDQHFSLLTRILQQQCKGVFYQPTLYGESELYMRYAQSDPSKLGTNLRDVFFCQVTPMDKDGFFNWGLHNSCCYLQATTAKACILEVNENIPYCYGGNMERIHISEVTYVVEGENTPLAELPEVSPTDTDRKIAENVLSYLKDGDCIQLGIGGMPNILGKMISETDLKDLGGWTEMLVDAYLTMHEKGKLTNKYKSWDKGKGAWTFCMGSQKLYDWVDRNPSLASYPSNYTNDPKVIAQIDNFISVNNCVEVDLYGQVSSESAGIRQISGTGGQLDFVTGAYLSNGGKSFICFRSAFEDRKTGQASSRVVPALPPSSIVTVPRTQVHYLVTEWGKVNLAGCSTWERAERIISISHPDFRDELIKQAETMKIWRRSNRI